MKEIYKEFGINIHLIPIHLESEINELVKEIIKLRKNNNVNLEKVLSDCWDAADDYREQLDRINSGLSNFDKPTYPNKKEWISKFIKNQKS